MHNYLQNLTFSERQFGNIRLLLRQFSIARQCDVVDFSGTNVVDTPKKRGDFSLYPTNTRANRRTTSREWNETQSTITH